MSYNETGCADTAARPTPTTVRPGASILNFRTLGTLEESDYTWADRGIRCLTATFLGLLECASHARLDRGYARGASENID